MTTPTPATSEIEKWLRILSGFSQIFDSGSWSDRKTQNPAWVDSGTPDPVPLLSHTRARVISKLDLLDLTQREQKW